MQLGLSEKEALRQLYIKVLKYQTKKSDSNTSNSLSEKRLKLIKLKNANKNAEDKLRQLREKCQMLGLKNQKILVNEEDSVDDMSVDFQPTSSSEQSLQEFDSVFSTLPNPPLKDKSVPVSPSEETSEIKSEKELDSSLEENTSVIDLETDDVEMDTNEDNLDGESGIGSNIDLLI